MLAHLADHRGDVRGFCDHAELAGLALEHGADAVADDRVIVGDDHVDRSGDAWGAALHLRNTVAAREDRSNAAKPTSEARAGRRAPA